MKKSLILILLMFILLLGACGKKAPEVIDPNPDDNTEEETPIEVPKFEVYISNNLLMTPNVSPITNMLIGFNIIFFNFIISLFK